MGTLHERKCVLHLVVLVHILSGVFIELTHDLRLKVIKLTGL